MSSATAIDDPMPPGRYTYWCHDCDMSVSLRSSRSLLCPHCFGDFLELMDSSSSSSPRSSTDSPFPPLSAAADNFLHHLVRHLAADDYFHNNPNPAAVDDTLVTVEIAASLLETDPLVFCAVCKDQFVVGVEAKQLPCKHLYHPDCILPWLANHTTCPVCRFQLPTKPLNPRRSSAATTPFRFGDLLAGDEDRFGYGSTLRYIARRHRDRLSLGNGDENSSLSPTQMAEAEIGLVARTSSGETVSSCPVEAVGAGSRELGVSGRATEDAADAPIAGVKVSSSSVS